MKTFLCALAACAVLSACGLDCESFETCQANPSFVESCTSGDRCNYVVHDASGGSRTFNCPGTCASNVSSLDTCTAAAIDYYRGICP